jgi:predicted Zn-dependent peptidase
VAGDLSGLDLPSIVEEHLGLARPGRRQRPRPTHSGANCGRRPVVLVDRPGSAQSELRVGHVGLARKTRDFYTVSVLNAILGGIFDSRLNRVIREEKGYAYSIWSSFDMRRSAGPFVVRTASRLT